jgi:hypothetical protein
MKHNEYHNTEAATGIKGLGNSYQKIDVCLTGATKDDNASEGYRRL